MFKIGLIAFVIKIVINLNAHCLITTINFSLYKKNSFFKKVHLKYILKTFTPFLNRKNQLKVNNKKGSLTNLKILFYKKSSVKRYKVFSLDRCYLYNYFKFFTKFSFCNISFALFISSFNLIISCIELSSGIFIIFFSSSYTFLSVLFNSLT